MEFGIRLLTALEYHGVAQLDFRNRREGISWLLDFDARLAGTNEISARGGVNFPLMLYRLALGEKPDTVLDVDTELEFRWLLFGEVLHSLQTDQKIQVARELLKWKTVSTNARRPTEVDPEIRTGC